MRAFAILFTLIVIFIAGCKTGPQPIDGIADQLRHSTSSYWSVTTSNNTIFVRSKDEVYRMNPINPPTGYELDEEASFKQYGWKTNYEVVLSFVPRLTDSELDAIKEKRRPYVNVHIRTITAYFQVNRALAKLPLPSFYTDDYSVFVSPEPYGGGWLVYPPEAAQQVNNLTNTLKKTFQSY